jgi:hypothetical protein
MPIVLNTIEMNNYIYNLKKLGKAVMLVLLSIASISGFAQLRVILTVNSRPSAYLAEWYRPVNGTVVITSLGMGAVDRPVRFETEILNSEGQMVYQLPFKQSQPVSYSSNAGALPLSEILQLQNGNFSSPQMANSFSEGGKLAAGQYSIRLRLWDGMEDQPRTEWTASKPFLISSYQLPQLMQPADGKALEAKQANSYIIFRWTPLTPTMQGALATYRIQIWQVLPDQTPMQSMRSTPPIEDRLIKGTTQFTWQPRLNMIVPEPAATNQFIWTVQTLDEKGMPIETTDPSVQGISQPFTFSFVNKKAVSDSIAVSDNP